MNKFLLVTNAGSSGSTWHIFREGEEDCICKGHSIVQLPRNTPKKKVKQEKLVDLLRKNESPGLGSWAGKCRRKALEDITGEKQFSCPLCGKGISTRSGLISHISGIHEKPSKAAKEMAAAKGGF